MHQEVKQPLPHCQKHSCFRTAGSSACFLQCHSQGGTSANLHSNYLGITQAILFYRYVLDIAVRILYTVSEG